MTIKNIEGVGTVVVHAQHAQNWAVTETTAQCRNREERNVKYQHVKNESDENSVVSYISKDVFLDM